MLGNWGRPGLETLVVDAVEARNSLFYCGCLDLLMVFGDLVQALAD